MINFYKITALISLAILLNLSTAYAQESDPVSSAEETIPDITFETVKGDKINLNQLQKEAYVLFLLTKPESKSAGKEKMSQIRTWIQKIESETDNVFTMLIAEPFKTSFPFFGIQKRKLKNEPFPVVIDKNKETLNRLGVEKVGLDFLLIDKELKIIDHSSTQSDSFQIDEKITLINNLKLDD